MGPVEFKIWLEYVQGNLYKIKSNVKDLVEEILMT